MEKPWKVIAAFIAVFMAGAVFGGLFTLRASGKRFADWRVQERPAKNVLPAATAATPATTAATTPAPDAAKTVVGSTAPVALPARVPLMPALMQQFTRHLKLNAAQKEKARPIFSRASEDLQRLRQENEVERQRNLADTVRVTERMYSDVSALLSPEQKVELEVMRAQMQQRLDKDRKRRAELQADLDRQFKAEKAAADAEGKNSAATPVLVPTAKPVEKGK